MTKPHLPIDALLPEIVRAVETDPILLLEAEPGAGKTTRVPIALIDAGFEHVYVLEPRRIAARLAARRVADELGDSVGGLVGYQVRFEQVSSARTRLWYFTEGVLTRRLLSDPQLRPARVVVLDEFHERHLETDLALALLRRLQQSRTDLRLVLMSATLGSRELAEALGPPRIIRAPGRIFPVTIRFTAQSNATLETQVASAVSTALAETAGHVLVFLPGAAEIRKALAACESLAQRRAAKLLPLHGDLSPDEQDAAVAPGATRKIICSTNVAESSVTIDGVSAVIDSGFARVLSHSPWSGLSRLRVEKISRASAIQRSGRAGRTGPGLAIRLYPESDFVRRREQIAPEILRSDLTQLLLEVAISGLAWNDLTWLDAPPVEMREHAADLLERLGATHSGQLTDTGRQMGRLPLHPRLARLAVEAARKGARAEGAELAARLAESRLRFEESNRGQLASDLDLLFASDLTYTARRLTRQILDAIRPSNAERDDHALEKALLSAYGDRVARKRGENLLLSNGASAKLDRQSLARSEFLVAIEVDDRVSDSVPLVRIATSIEPDWLLDFFPERIKATEEMIWNREGERVEQLNALRYDALVIDESRSAPRDSGAAADLLVAKALEAGIHRFAEAEELDRFVRRVRFAGTHAPHISFDESLVRAALRQLAEGLSSFNQLRDAGRDGALLSILQSMLPMRLIEEIAPSHIVLPRGRRVRIEYHEDRPPSIASRLQDFFGLRDSPTVARGSVPLVLQLLAPNQRPVQVTTDLPSFWANLYPQVRKELSRRYPKHSWPEVPT